MRGLFSTTKTAGRGKKLKVSEVHREALDMGLTVHHPENFKSEKDQIIFRNLNADVAVVVAYGLLLPKPILSSPKLGCVNIHASLLPRGAAPLQSKEQLWMAMMKPVCVS